LLVCTIGLRGNGKIGEINRKAVSGTDRCLCPDVGGVHGNPWLARRCEVIAIHMADGDSAKPRVFVLKCLISRSRRLAVSRSSASSRSRISRATTVSWPAMEAPRLRMAFGALRRFGVDCLRRRAYRGLLIALERRLIAFLKAQDKAL
jgi:hypothetical protein